MSKLGFTKMLEGTATAHTAINDAIARIGASHVCVSRTTDVPGLLVEGAAYLIGPTSSWPGSHLHEIAVWTNGAWSYITPYVGLSTFIVSHNAHIVYYGGAWRWINCTAQSFTTISTGNKTLDFTDASTLAYQMTSSGGTYTMIPPATTMMPGLLYQTIFYNSSAGSVTVRFQSTDGWLGYENVTVSASRRMIAQYVQPLSGDPIVAYIQNDIQPL